MPTASACYCGGSCLLHKHMALFRWAQAASVWLPVDARPDTSGAAAAAAQRLCFSCTLLIQTSLWKVAALQAFRHMHQVFCYVCMLEMFVVRLCCSATQAVEAQQALLPLQHFQQHPSAQCTDCIACTTMQLVAHRPWLHNLLKLPESIKLTGFDIHCMHGSCTITLWSVLLLHLS